MIENEYIIYIVVAIIFCVVCGAIYYSKYSMDSYDDIYIKNIVRKEIEDIMQVRVGKPIAETIQDMESYVDLFEDLA